MWVATAIRSAPAAGICAARSARLIAVTKASRRRASTRMPPGRAILPDGSGVPISPLISAAIALASLVSAARRRFGRRRSSRRAPRFAGRTARGRTTIRPGSSRRLRRMRLVAEGGDAIAEIAANTVSTPSSTSVVERKESDSGFCTKLRPASSAFRRKNRSISASISGAAPWKLKIDCLSSPTAKIVRSRSTAAPAPEKKSSATPGDDVPLVGTGILRLVDEDVVDARIELVEHPGGRIGARQKVAGADDQVVEIERRGAQLCARVAIEDRVADEEERLGRGVGLRRVVALDERQQPLRLGLEILRQVRPLLAEGLAEPAAFALRPCQPALSFFRKNSRRATASAPASVAPQDRVERGMRADIDPVAGLGQCMRRARRRCAGTRRRPRARIGRSRRRASPPSRRRARPRRDAKVGERVVDRAARILPRLAPPGRSRRAASRDWR